MSESQEYTLETGPLPGPEEQKDKKEEETKEKKPRGRAAVKIKLESLETELADRIREYVAVPLGMISPLGCAVLDERADRTAKALCRIAATSPAMRRALERFVQGSAVVDVAGTMIAVSIAVGVDLQRLEPMSMPAQFANVPYHWKNIYPDETMFRDRVNGHSEEEFRGSFLAGENGEPAAGN